jgi:glycosyltransferase involved in cell wall biosynthesis
MIRSEAARQRHIIRERMRNSMALGRLKQVDGRPIPTTTDEVRLFVKARNEAERFPYFLDHYFALGIDRVFIIDNHSDDSSRDVALSRANVHMFVTREPFDRAVYWMNSMLARYGMGSWCMAADVDELLVLPPPALHIREAIAYLDHVGATALQALLLDMYPLGRFADAPSYRAGQNPIEICPGFDPEFTRARVDVLNWQRLRRFSADRFSGGVRRRLFDLDMNLTKIALFKMRPDTWLADGAHHVDGATVADLRAAMLHFKHMPGQLGRIGDDARRGLAAGGGAYLAPVAAGLESGAVERFDYPGSRRLESAQQLTDLGVIATTGAFERFLAEYRESASAPELAPAQPDFQFTVFTPVYNMAHTVARLMSCLRSQTFRDFEWIVVNDGSTDELDLLIASFTGTTDFPIIYLTQQNSGKPAAWNRAVEIARGELFVTMDADDEFVPEALETLHRAWTTICNPLAYSGVACPVVDSATKALVGEPFPTDMFDSNDIALKYELRLTAEKWGAVRTKVLREFPFPEIPGEKSIPESYIWNQISTRYKNRYINTPLRVYHQDTPESLTKVVTPLLYPRSRFEWLLVESNTTFPYWAGDLKQLIVRYRRLGKFCVHAGESPVRTMTRIIPKRGRLIFAVLFPIGYVDAMRDRRSGRIASLSGGSRHRCPPK